MGMGGGVLAFHSSLGSSTHRRHSKNRACIKVCWVRDSMATATKMTTMDNNTLTWKTGSSLENSWQADLRTSVVREVAVAPIAVQSRRSFPRNHCSVMPPASPVTARLSSDILLPRDDDLRAETFSSRRMSCCHGPCERELSKKNHFPCRGTRNAA